jgi:hypothetical protein
MEAMELTDQVRLSYKQEVRGSSPRAPTIFFNALHDRSELQERGFDTGPPAFSRNLLLPYQNPGVVQCVKIRARLADRAALLCNSPGFSPP